MKPVAGCRSAIGAIFGLLLPFMLAAAETPPTAEIWPEEDSQSRALQVNEGQLQFIAPVQSPSILHSDTHLWIDAESKKTGWVNMHQCYRHLDAVNRTDVVYAYGEMKNLRVTRAEQIAQTRLTPRGVELEEVKKDAQLCVQAEVKILRRLPDGAFSMQNGPYHRKFFDGYYPYHVSLTVHYDNAELRLERVTPRAQEGFYLTEKAGLLSIDSWFEGELRIGFMFSED